MPAKKYCVVLTAAERAQLQVLTTKGTTSARRMRRAQILLRAAEGATDAAIAASLHVGHATVARTRRKYSEGGLSQALHERPRPGGTRKLDGKQEAFLVALACSGPPDGRTHWTMQLLADRLVTVGVVDAISDETVRRALKKTRPSPG